MYCLPLSLSNVAPSKVKHSLQAFTYKMLIYKAKYVAKCHAHFNAPILNEKGIYFVVSSL